MALVTTHRFLLALVISLFAGLIAELHAQTPDYLDQFSYEPHQIEDDFDLTGFMDYPAWAQAPVTELYHQRQPNDERPAPVPTQVKVLYSKTHLYIGFKSEDPEPNKIRANITDRDGFFGDDYVGVILDTYANNQEAYEFVVNPLGVQMDATRTASSEDFNFDALWYSAANITEDGYTAVMKIPFKSFNFPDREVQNWSIQFIRNYPRENRYQLSWTNVKLDNSCLLCQSGSLINIEDVESSKTVEILPYAAATQSAAINDPTDGNSGLNNQAPEAKIGGSISYSPSSSSSLDVVFNPDFSQVETDAAQISVNETFALYFSEKRPFFVKGSDLFSTREDLYYSRTINNPLAAAKYIQKNNSYSIAFLSAYDRNTPFIVPGRERSSLVQTKQESYSNVLRAKYNFGNESQFGGLLTTRNYGSGYNYVGSLDWDLLLSSNYYFRGQASYSKTRELDNTALHEDNRTFGDTGYNASFDGEEYDGTLINTEFAREAKYYDFSFEYKAFSPTFQTQNGFINQTNSREIGASQSISYYPDNRFLSQGSLSTSGTLRYDHQGNFYERYVFVRLNNSLGGQNNLNLNFLPLNDERFRGVMFRNIYRGTISFNSNTWDVFSFGSSFEIGRNINRSGTPTLGKGYSFSADATLKPTERFQMTLDYNYSKLSDIDTDQTFYSGDIYRLNTRYNFSRKLFLRFISEYDSFNEQIQFYPLFYYKANAFTKFYIGMTNYITDFDTSINNGFRDYRQTSREFFIKFQYLIRS